MDDGGGIAGGRMMIGSGPAPRPCERRVSVRESGVDGMPGPALGATGDADVDEEAAGVSGYAEGGGGATEPVVDARGGSGGTALSAGCTPPGSVGTADCDGERECRESAPRERARIGSEGCWLWACEYA